MSARGAKDRSYDLSPGEKVPHLWGYCDTRFEFVDARTVRVTGKRYPLAGPPLPRFIPFVEEVFGVPLGPDQLQPPVPPPPLPPPVRHDDFRAALNRILEPDQIASDDHSRLVHSHGQLSVNEIYRILNGSVPERVVDLVVYPQTDDEIVQLIRLADVHEAVLIPYGGGTNVSGALLCPPEEDRPIVSVDLRQMNRILEVDRQNHWVVVQAGITGKDLEAQLEAAGYTCGHVPDSIEFSTLGGWIATNASGMKKNRYGNIEDIVLEAVLVTPRGEVRSFPINPRSAAGVQPRHFVFGSEGCLGIITRAVLQVRPLPEVREFASFVFRDFATGVRFLRQVQIAGVRPASIRLVNNTEFRLGQALSAEGAGWHRVLSRLKKLYVLKWRRFDVQRMVACTVVMEGGAAEVQHQRKALDRLRREQDGLPGGAEGGRRGYRTTFAIAYIRDFLNQLGVIGETFETSAPWSRIDAITSAVEAELHRLCASQGIPGRPYLSFRVSQSYQVGVCLYFTMGFCARGVPEADRRYQEIEHRLREVILEAGGSISHHHGVGKVRRDFVRRVQSDAAIMALHAVKRALDPHNVFAAGNQAFGLEFPVPPGPTAETRQREQSEANVG